MKPTLTIVGKSLLFLATGATLIDCAGMLGYISPLTLPLLTGLLWLAARRSGIWDLAVWYFLAGAAGWRLGQMIDCAYPSTCGELPFIPVLISFSLVFLFTTTSERRPPRNQPF